MLPKTLPTGHNCLWTAKTGSSAAGTFSYSRKHTPTSFLPLLRNYLTVSNLPSATNFTTPLLHTPTQGSRTSNKRVGKTTCTSQQNCKDNQRLSRSSTPPLGRAVSEQQSPELCLALSDKIRTHRDCIQHAYAFRHKENI